MKIHDILETEQIIEGPHDPNIFKAVFLAGGPGAGKSYVSDNLLKGKGLKPINSDDVYEYLANKHDVDLSDPEVVGGERGQELRQRAKEITKTRENLYLDGRLAARFHVVDNSGGLEDPDRKVNFDKVYKEILKFLNEQPSKRAAKAWLTKNTKT